MRHPLALAEHKEMRSGVNETGKPTIHRTDTHVWIFGGRFRDLIPLGRARLGGPASSKRRKMVETPPKSLMGPVGDYNDNDPRAPAPLVRLYTCRAPYE